MSMREERQINRIITLTFRVSGVDKVNEETHKITTAIEATMRMVLAMRVMMYALESPTDPIMAIYGGVMAVTSAAIMMEVS